MSATRPTFTEDEYLAEARRHADERAAHDATKAELARVSDLLAKRERQLQVVCGTLSVYVDVARISKAPALAVVRGVLQSGIALDGLDFSRWDDATAPQEATDAPH